MFGNKRSAVSSVWRCSYWNQGRVPRLLGTAPYSGTSNRVFMLVNTYVHVSRRCKVPLTVGALRCAL